MLDTAYKIAAFSQFEEALKDFLSKIKDEGNLDTAQKEFYAAIKKAKHYNGWFDEQSILNALSGIRFMLEKTKLEDWVTSYSFKDNNSKKIGLILAGNIPFVGWHDILSVVMSGHIAVIKPSSDDGGLTKALIDYLFTIAPEIRTQIQFVEKLKDIDAIIATGSNNSQRYFEQYFGHLPHIFRKNRNSVAILTGSESEKELMNLADDMMYYYGLGCRNVSKLYLPKDYDLNKIFKAVYENYKHLVQHKKYANNFDYHKAIYLMNQMDILENGILIMKEDEEICSPVAVCFYEFYKNKEILRENLLQQKEKIQCIVTSDKTFENTINFGEAQFPTLKDYADGVDTMDFLNKI